MAKEMSIPAVAEVSTMWEASSMAATRWALGVRRCIFRPVAIAVSRMAVSKIGVLGVAAFMGGRSLCFALGWDDARPA